METKRQIVVRKPAEAFKVLAGLAIDRQVCLGPLAIQFWDVGSWVDFGLNASADAIDEKLSLVFINDLPQKKLRKTRFGLESGRGMASSPRRLHSQRSQRADAEFPRCQGRRIAKSNRL